jgi:transposase
VNIKPVRMSKTSRRKFSAEFKSKVCIEAIKEQQTIEALAKKYEVHPTQINSWKKEFLKNSATVFEKEGTGSSGDEKDQLIQALYAQIGEQKVSIDFLKKKLL